MSRIVQLSEAASIGLHAMVIIASSEKLTKVTDIAKITGASKNHLSKVMQHFVKDGLIKSTRGPTGGFLLNKSPDEISLLEIYESVEGPLKPTKCPMNNIVCPFNKCIMGGLITNMTNQFIDYFKSQTLKNFISE